MEGASTTHKEEDDGQAPRLLDAPVKIQDQEGNDREGLDFMWGTDKVQEQQSTNTMSSISFPLSMFCRLWQALCIARQVVSPDDVAQRLTARAFIAMVVPERAWGDTAELER